MCSKPFQIGCGAALVAFAWGAHAAEAIRGTFGALPDGRAVDAVTLTNAHGLAINIIALGASVQSLIAPDQRGVRSNIVLGYADIGGYLRDPQYFGATVGRFANRLAKGRFTLDGKVYQLATNDGPNALHGGKKGFDKVLWSVLQVKSGPSASVTLGYESPDGEEGYPGALSVTAEYTLSEANEMTVEYRAVTNHPTIVNISNHTYFNLGGEGSNAGVLGHLLMIPANEFTPVDATLIPTGEFRSVAGTALDFRQAKPIGRDIRDGSNQQLMFGRGYDHNWVLSRTSVAVPRLVARVEDPISGRILELLSDQPGLQFYSGNFLNSTVVGGGGRLYRQGDAFALEPQLFPDTPNQPAFGSARLEPGQTYRNRITYRILARHNN